MTDYLHADIPPTSETLIQSWDWMGAYAAAPNSWVADIGTYWTLIRRWEALDWPDTRAVLNALDESDLIDIPFAGGPWRDGRMLLYPVRWAPTVLPSSVPYRRDIIMVYRAGPVRDEVLSSVPEEDPKPSLARRIRRRVFDAL